MNWEKTPQGFDEWIFMQELPRNISLWNNKGKLPPEEPTLKYYALNKT